DQPDIDCNIPVQREVAPGVITEPGYHPFEQDGTPCVSLSLLCRQTHSREAVASLRDLTHCIRLLTALAGMSEAHFPAELDPGT
ncbi:M42 family metallopeptidase, partial [Escherichia coli]